MNPRKLCLFSHAVHRVSKTTLRLVLQKFPEHAVDFVFSDEKVFTVASPVNLQNDRVYASSNAKKRDIAPERLLLANVLLVADGVRCCLKTGLHWAVLRQAGGESGRQILRWWVSKI